MKEIIRLSIIVLLLVSSIMLTGCSNDISVQFDAKNYTAIKEVMVKSESRVSEPVNPINEGYIFLGWYSDNLLQNEYNFNDEVTESLILKAKWELNEIIISYETNGSSVIDPIDINISFITDAYVTPVKTGYIFLGWFNEDLDIEYEVDTFPGEDVTFYAKWEILQFSIMFLGSREVEVSDQLVDYNSLAVEPSDLSNDDYIFVGWYIDSALTNLYDFSSPVLNHEILYAKWKSRNLTITFTPSRDPAEILTVTEPLSELLKEELEALGYYFDNVYINVSTSNESAVINLLTGTSDVAYLPSSVYALYMDEVEIDVALSATRNGITKDFDEAIDWNDGLPTEDSSTIYFPYYRGLILAGTSTAARTLADKVNSGTELVWDDVKDLNWCVRGDSSPSGYIYPNHWLMEMFDGKTISDLTYVKETGGYGATIAELAAGTCDVGTVYSDARMHYIDSWIGDYGRTESIWVETDVIGVTERIMSDVIAISTTTVSEELKIAIQQAYINISLTPEGLEVMEISSHQGYVIATKEDYRITKHISIYQLFLED